MYDKYDKRLIILYFAVKYEGKVLSIVEAIHRKEPIDDVLFDKIVEEYKEANYITILDEEYPPLLKNIRCPPILLFYRGNLKLLNHPNIIAIVGSRKSSEYGERATKKIINELANTNACIVSGLAKGIDSCAHNAAMDNNLPTIAVLGCSIDICYPESSLETYKRILKQDGLILSEYPKSIPPLADNFLVRNRIISGLSPKIVVAEASIRSGSLNTASNGLYDGRLIYAIPYPIDIESGCNKLIKEGAFLLENGKDLME